MTYLPIITICFLIVILLSLLRLCVFLPFTNTENITIGYTIEDAAKKQKKHIMILLGSGGHTGEMLRFWQSWTVTDDVELSFVLTESRSLEKVYLFENEMLQHFLIERYYFGQEYLPKGFEVKYNSSRGDDLQNINCHKDRLRINYIILPRARNINQSYFSSIFSTLTCFYAAFKTFYFEICDLPDVIFCNGPGTSVPVCYILVLIDYMSNVTTKRKKIIYIESLARVERLSLSGILLYPIATKFIVQWRKLSLRLPRAEYHGILV